MPPSTTPAAGTVAGRSPSGLPACAFGAAITNNRGHPRQAQREKNPGWPGQLVVRVASVSERQAGREAPGPVIPGGVPACGLPACAFGAPITSNRGHPLIGATRDKRKGKKIPGGPDNWLSGSRASASDKREGKPRGRLSPAAFPLAPSAPRLQVIGATRRLSPAASRLRLRRPDYK